MMEVEDIREKRSMLPALGLLASIGLIGMSAKQVYRSASSSSSGISSVAQMTTLDSVIDKSSDDGKKWNYYKHTTSTNIGTSESVYEFVDTYFTELFAPTSLGCNSTKLYGTILYGFQLHWVDSDVFPTSGKDVGEWNDYVFSLGFDTFNPFLHNKVQLYVSDLSSHYSKISTSTDANMSPMYRLSTDSDGEQVAHIGVMIPYTGHVYELVGPASSLTSSDLKQFTEWTDVDGSCPSAHTLPQTLSALSATYAIDSSKQQKQDPRDINEERRRDRRAGESLPSVMVVSMSIATSDLDSITTTLQLAQEVAGNGAYYETVTYDSDACSVSTFYLPNNVPVLYVQNENNKDAGKYTVADWEADVAQTHTEYETDSRWNRYMDTHIGIDVDDSANCDTNMKTANETVMASGMLYSMRDTHFYTATPGLRTWEFNVAWCWDSLPYRTQLCGCVAENSQPVYASMHTEAFLETQYKPCGYVVKPV